MTCDATCQSETLVTNWFLFHISNFDVILMENHFVMQIYLHGKLFQ